MHTPASIAGHPIHPMLVPIAIGCFVFSFAADILCLATGEREPWNLLAYYTMLGGIIGALAAAAPGLVDLLSLPAGPIKKTALTDYDTNRQGGIIAISVFALLVLMSVFSFYILFTKLMQQQKIISQGRKVRASFWNSPNLRDGANKLDQRSAYRAIVDDALLAQCRVEHYRGSGPGGRIVRADLGELADEIARVQPVFERLSSSGADVSVDTRKSEVMSVAIKAGARLVNDVSALTFDPRSAHGVVVAAQRARRCRQRGLQSDSRTDLERSARARLDTDHARRNRARLCAGHASALAAATGARDGL